MDCPGCHTSNPPDQKYCGTCGHKLEFSCDHCGANNPPSYKFCGQCGASMNGTNMITLARSGLISQVDKKALEVLGYQQGEMQGKPFSIFVDRNDLVVFFSHWNELTRHCQPQKFEIALKTKNAETIYVLMEGSGESPSCDNSDQFQLIFSEVTESRLQSDQMQEKHVLLSLVFTLSDSINTVSNKHLDRSIEDALKKICLFAKADRCFIYSIDRRLKRLVPAYQWRHPATESTGDDPGPVSVPFTMIKRAIVRLRKEHAYIVSNVADLPASERYELLAWHKADLDAFACHLIYSKKRPIGIIGLANHAGVAQWSEDCMALVKFLGQCVSPRLPFSRESRLSGNSPETGRKPRKKTNQIGNSVHVLDINPKLRPKEIRNHDEIQLPTNSGDPSSGQQTRPDAVRPMLLEKLTGQAIDQQPVFPRDDGLVLLTCPRCGLQESVSLDQIISLGNAVSVNCSCRKLFSAVLERRRAYRKKMNLDGFFTLKSDLEPVDAPESFWGPMVVKDLSKAGLRFSSHKADLIRPGDIIMVRFNLDNASQSLINKPARVVSTSNKEVGCRFEGADKYDITLGFYFI